MKISKVIKAARETEPSTYATVIGHLRSAIDALGEHAKDDEKARDAIANISVVLLDLSAKDDSVETEE